MQRKSLEQNLFTGVEMCLIVISAVAGIQLDFLSLSMLALVGLYDILCGISDRLKNSPALLRLACSMGFYIFTVNGVLLLLTGVSLHLLNPIINTHSVNIPLTICLAWFIWAFCNGSRHVFSLNGRMYWGIPLAVLLLFALRSNQHIIICDSLFTAVIALNLIRKCYFQTVQETIPF